LPTEAAATADAQMADLRQWVEAKEARKARKARRDQEEAHREENGQIDYCVCQWLDVRLEIERLPRASARKALAQVQEDIASVLADFDELDQESAEPTIDERD
jgi:hypothetical protein